MSQFPGAPPSGPTSKGRGFAAGQALLPAGVARGVQQGRANAGKGAKGGPSEPARNFNSVRPFQFQSQQGQAIQRHQNSPVYDRLRGIPQIPQQNPFLRGSDRGIGGAAGIPQIPQQNPFQSPMGGKGQAPVQRPMGGKGGGGKGGGMSIQPYRPPRPPGGK